MGRNTIFDDLGNLHWDMERLFHSLLNPMHPFQLLADKCWKPLTDMYAIDNELVIKVEIPGVQKEDISITLEDRHLVIRGTREIPQHKSGITYYQMEINYGEFERVLMLPDCADTETIKAELKENEGFLYIRIKTTRQTGKED